MNGLCKSDPNDGSQRDREGCTMSEKLAIDGGYLLGLNHDLFQEDVGSPGDRSSTVMKSPNQPKR